MRMLQIITCMVLFCTLSFGQPFPYAASLPVARPVIPTVASIVPTAYSFGPTPRPFPGVAGYQNPLLPGVVGYGNLLVSGVPGYNNPYQYNRSPGALVPILTYSSEHAGDGTYSFSFTTGDGKQAQEAGYLKDAYIDNGGEPQGTQVVQGSYAYISPEGTPIQVSYIADENGFRPSGVHIPADGKAVVPAIRDGSKQILDLEYNRYDPFNYRSRYNNVGKFNRQDPRYPYDATKYNYNNPYFNNQYLAAGLNKGGNDISKKNP